MFHLHTTTWAEWDAWVLTDDSGQHSATIIPALGGIVNALTLHGAPVIQGYTEAAEARSLYYYKGAWLFPFANRLKHGVWHWNGQEFRWPVNDVQNGHALHGGIADQPFQVKETFISKLSASISLLLQAPHGLGAAYPFPFELTVTYTLSHGALAVDVQVYNAGESVLPYHLGWHPYCMVPGNLADWELQLPPSSRALLHPDFMPTGQWLVMEDGGPMHLGQRHLDLCLRNNLAAPDTCVQVAGRTATLVYEQRGFDYYMLFTPSEWRTAIAIEPMTGTINCLNTGEGLVQLAPGMDRSHKVSLTLLPVNH